MLTDFVTSRFEQLPGSREERGCPLPRCVRRDGAQIQRIGPAACVAAAQRARFPESLRAGAGGGCASEMRGTIIVLAIGSRAQE